MTRNRSRACENPAPQHGGLKCLTLNGTHELNEDEFQSCNLSCCIGKNLRKSFFY